MPSVAAEQDLLGSRAAELLARAQSAGSPLMFFVGVGDHGGGPTSVAIAKVRALAEETAGAMHLRLQRCTGISARPNGPWARGSLFRGARRSPHARCRLLLGRGLDQRENAICEDALMTAEKMASLCEMATGMRSMPASSCARPGPGCCSTSSTTPLAAPAPRR